MTKRLTRPRLLVEGAGNCADLVYRSGFTPVDPVVFVDEGRRGLLVVPMLELSRARLEVSRGITVVLPEQLGVPRESLRRLGSWALYALKKRGIRRVGVSSFFPVGIVRLLEENRIRVHVEDGPLYPGRAVKRAEEISRITESQRAAVRAMRAAEHTLREAKEGRGGRLFWGGAPLTSERLRAVIDRVLLDNHCMASDTIVAGGAQAADPHERGHGPLRAGTSIVIDIFPRHKQHGYWGDITRTYCKGKAPPALARMYRTVLKAQRTALSMVREGVEASAIHEMISRDFDLKGYPVRVEKGVVRGFFHGTGHGVGLEIHEAPSIGKTPVTLRAGHVVTIEPGLYDPDIGGVRIEDTVAVEKNGARLLARHPKVFEV